jgi:iron(III) transport system ATP-binding protein
MAELELEGVSLSFGRLVVLDGLDLAVADGRTLAVVGPSGCGKTTMLRLVAGFEVPDAGRIRIGERVVAGESWVPAHLRGIGYVPQDGALFPHLTVGQNIAFGLPRGADRTRRLADLLDLVSLDPQLADRRPDQLSGGQQQRVALARAFAVNPSVMLLDEPFAALDAELRADTRGAVRDLLRAAGVTTVVVTHDPEDAIEFADEVAVMAEGRIREVGPPAEVFARIGRAPSRHVPRSVEIPVRGPLG